MTGPDWYSEACNQRLEQIRAENRLSSDIYELERQQKHNSSLLCKAEDTIVDTIVGTVAGIGLLGLFL